MRSMTKIGVALFVVVAATGSALGYEYTQAILLDQGDYELQFALPSVSPNGEWASAWGRPDGINNQERGMLHQGYLGDAQDGDRQFVFSHYSSPGSYKQRINAVDNNGTSVGWSIQVGRVPTYWTNSSATPQKLPSMHGGFDHNWRGGRATDINASGMIVGFESRDADANDDDAIRWTPDGSGGLTVTVLNTNATVDSYAKGVNNNGVVVGNYGTSACWWEADGTFHELTHGTFGTYTSATLNAINDDGWAAGQDNGNTAFLYNVLTDVLIELPEMHSSNDEQSYDINSSGVAIGLDGWGNVTWIYDSANGMRDLQDLVDPALGITIMEPGEISDTGVVAIRATDGNAYLLVPEPASVTLLGIGGLLVLKRRRRSRKAD